MPLISTLHQGMNLRDPDQLKAPGETGESIGVDFSTPGIIRPMRQANATVTPKSGVDIACAACLYIGTNRYYFTTHGEGLRVSGAGLSASDVTGTHKAGYATSAFLVDSAGRNLVDLGIRVGSPVYNKTQGVNGIITDIESQDATYDKLVATLSGVSTWEPGNIFSVPISWNINSTFHGNFKALVINDEYVVFSSANKCVKWKPGWRNTKPWGLNTPSAPTLYAGQVNTKWIETFEDINGWASVGGGAGGAMALDTANYSEGVGSLKLTSDSGNTITASKNLLTANHVSNPGFETAGAGAPDIHANWTEAASDGAIADEAAIFHAGGSAHSVKITTGATIDDTSALTYQTIPVLPGSVYVFEAWVYGNGSASGRYRIRDVTHSTNIIPIISAYHITASWELVTFDLTIPDGCFKISVTLYGPEVNGGITYWDDLSLKLKAELDLSKYLTDGDLKYSFVRFAYYTASLETIAAIRFKLSCAADGLFNHDYYSYEVKFSGEKSAILRDVAGGVTKADSELLDYDSSINTNVYSGGSDLLSREPQDPYTKSMVPYVLKGDAIDGESPENVEVEIPIIAPTNVTKTESGAWTHLRIQMDSFVRIGKTTGRDWSTITGIQIELEAQPESITTAKAIASFDWMQMIGGGLWGYYWVAVSFQNEFANYGPYSEFVGPQLLEGQDLIISNIAVDTDAQTVKRRLAILGGSITEPMVTYVDDNTTTTLTYNTLDSELVEMETMFHNRPPTGCLDMIAVQGRIFMVGVPGYPGRVVYSESLFFEAFPYRNYLDVKEGENLKQVCMFGQNVTVRGAREYSIYLAGPDPLYWSLPPGGARYGSESSFFLLELESGIHVFVSIKGLYFSATSGEDGPYLPKVSVAISNPSSVKGAISGQKAYFCFTDTAGISRVMRIDYSLGEPVAHYVENITPTCIFPDPLAKRVYYALEDTIYEFDGGGRPLATKLEIPGQFFGDNKLKAFDSMDYQLSGGPLSVSVKYDGVQCGAIVSLPDADAVSDPSSLPDGCGKSIGFLIDSTSEDYVLTLPLDLAGGSLG